MLGQCKRPRVKHQDAVTAGSIGEKQVLRDNASERAATDDHNIKWARVRA
jgi:hypothetical protein